MDKSPQKEMLAFFGEIIGIGGILFLIVGTVLVKILEIIGVVKITI